MNKPAMMRREARMLEVARLYLRGEQQQQIARKLEVSNATITRDVQDLHKLWRESAVRDFDEARGRELAKIDHLETVYWAEYEASKLEKETTETRRLAADEGQVRTSALIRKERRTGNPTYLAGVQWCIDRRIKLLGLDEPQKVDIEARIRVLAEAFGFDPDEAVEEARRRLGERVNLN